MLLPSSPPFDLATLLATAGVGRTSVRLKPKQAFFSQGDPANSVYYLREGRAKLTVISTAGKEATLSLLVPQDFIGQEAVLPSSVMRLYTATAITDCSAIKISREGMISVIHREQRLCDLLIEWLLTRIMLTQADLVDQLFNSSEKRLARVLLLMADYGGPGEPAELIPQISQRALGEMIGTTRSRVSFFMNRFRKLGLIEYDGRIRVHGSLLKAILHDRSSEQDM